jgi:hypothetical protein
MSRNLALSGRSALPEIWHLVDEVVVLLSLVTLGLEAF